MKKKNVSGFLMLAVSIMLTSAPAWGAADSIRIGSTKEEVISVYGEPQGTMTGPKGVIWMYAQGTIDFNGDKVAAISMATPKPVEKAPVAAEQAPVKALTEDVSNKQAAQKEDTSATRTNAISDLTAVGSNLPVDYLVEKNGGKSMVPNVYLGNITGEWTPGTVTVVVVSEVTNTISIGPNSHGGSDQVSSSKDEVLVMIQLKCAPPEPARIVDFASTALRFSETDLVRPLAIQAASDLSIFHYFSNGNGIIKTRSKEPPKAVGNNISYGHGFSVIFGGVFSGDSVITLLFRLTAKQAGLKGVLESSQ